MKSLILILLFSFSFTATAQTVDEIRSVIAKDCQEKASGIPSFGCKFAIGQVSLEETCRKEINKNFMAKQQLNELAFLYSQLTHSNEEQIRSKICESALVAHQTDGRPECEAEAKGEKTIERPWWNGSGWAKTEESLKDIIKKAESGNDLYQVNLGMYYEKGAKCLPKDRSLAVRNFCRSSDHGNYMAGVQLGMIGKDHGLPPERARDALGLKHGCELTEAQIARKEEEKHLEIEFKKNLDAAKKGNAKAIYKVATAYLNGDGVTEDYKECFSWAHKGADKGHVDSMALLASLYNRGDGIEKNQDKAFLWTLKAAKAGDRDSKLFLGDLYYNGQGTNMNKSEAIKWYLAAHESGNTDAKSRLKDMADRGELQMEILKRLR